MALICTDDTDPLPVSAAGGGGVVDRWNQWDHQWDQWFRGVEGCVE